ncbi:MAG: carboxymuconolactone decarboxylase family protein [Phycisphaerales bacterium]|nr:carboxymuconolactone decarboxylase family protein [Phycisphaerales bacterium]
MPRIQPVTDPTPASRALLDQVEQAFGGTPNLLATLGHSSAALGSYLAFSGALKDTSISGALREQIALAVAGANGCEYCASAHTLLARGQKVAESELSKNLEGVSDDPRTQAALRFATQVVQKRGWVDDAEVSAVREAGFGDAEILEIIATVSLNVFTNYVNHAVRTEVDFPRVEVPQPS